MKKLKIGDEVKIIITKSLDVRKLQYTGTSTIIIGKIEDGLYLLKNNEYRWWWDELELIKKAENNKNIKFPIKLPEEELYMLKENINQMDDNFINKILFEAYYICEKYKDEVLFNAVRIL